MNRITLIGRITRDLELKQTKSGKNVCEFGIAVNRDKDSADFINIQSWNNQAENLVKYQGKGSLISVDGSLRVDNYTKEDGTKTSRTYVLANNIEYLERKTEETKEETNPYEEYGKEIDINDSFLD